MAFSMKLADFSDRELLAILAELADDEGYATTAMLADSIGIDHINPNSCVGSRLAWLKKFGAVEIGKRRANGKTQWRLTDLGQELMSGQLNSAQERVLETLQDTQMLVTMRWVSGRWRKLDPDAATLVRREWTHGVLAQKEGTSTSAVQTVETVKEQALAG